MACSGEKKVKKCLTLNEKIEILKMYDSMGDNVRLHELAKILKISRSTLVTIISNRRIIETAPDSDRHRYRARNSRNNPQAGKSKYHLLEKALAKWVEELKNKGEPFNGVVLRKKAQKLASEMGFDNFTASNGWSDRFKKKYGIEYKARTCQCKYELKTEIPNKTNYGVENFLDKVVAEIKSKSDEGNQVNGKHKVLEIGTKLIQWLDEARNELNLTKISGNLIREMALSLAGIMGITNFTASNTWLNHFQKKYQFLKYNKCKKCRNNPNKN